MCYGSFFRGNQEGHASRHSIIASRQRYIIDKDNRLIRTSFSSSHGLSKVIIEPRSSNQVVKCLELNA